MKPQPSDPGLEIFSDDNPEVVMTPEFIKDMELSLASLTPSSPAEPTSTSEIWGSAHLSFLITSASPLAHALPQLGSDPVARCVAIVTRWGGYLSTSDDNTRMIAVVPAGTDEVEGAEMPLKRQTTQKVVDWLLSLNTVAQVPLSIYVAAERGTSHSPHQAPASRRVEQMAQEQAGPGLHLDTPLNQFILVSPDTVEGPAEAKIAVTEANDTKAPIGASSAFSSGRPETRTELATKTPKLSLVGHSPTPRPATRPHTHWAWSGVALMAAMVLLIILPKMSQEKVRPAIAQLTATQAVLSGSPAATHEPSAQATQTLNIGSKLSISSQVSKSATVYILQQDNSGQITYLGQDEGSLLVGEGMRDLHKSIQVVADEGRWRFILLASGDLSEENVKSVANLTTLDIKSTLIQCPDGPCRDTQWDQTAEVLMNNLGKSAEHTAIKISDTYHLVP